MFRAERITKALKNHDKNLYCARNADGILCVFKKSWRYDRCLMDETSIVFSRPENHCIFALTEGWKLFAKPVDWGIEPILAKVKASDLWARDIVSDIEAQEDKHNASLERDLKNKNEAFFSDAYSTFKRSFSDINTANLDKSEQKRRKRDVKCLL